MRQSSDENHILWPLLAVLLLAALIWSGERLQTPPAAQNPAVSATIFSAERAQIHVEKIAAQPHPAGSRANADVRDYLVGFLRGLGAEVDVQRRLQVYDYLPRAGQARFAYVENVVARFPGREPDAALLLMAHYDSVPNAPGAGDNASGVAVILETLRALSDSDLPMSNTLIVLFSDAEEVGLIGAQAFFDHHSWADEVELVLNFDSRGNHGPVFMYRTSENNGALIDALAQTAPSPTANSMVHEIMQRIPQFDDMAISSRANLAGMNFAFIEGYFDYHGTTDTAERLSKDSVQHLGSFALPMTRYFGEADLPVARSPDQVFFNPVGHTLVHYSPWVDRFVWLLAATLLAFATVRAWRWHALSLGQLLSSVGCALFLVALPVFFAFLMDRWIDHLVTLPEVVSRQRGWFIVWVLLATGCAVSLHGELRTGLGWAWGLIASSALIVLVLLGGVSWPLLAIALVTGIFPSLLWRIPLILEARIAGALWLLVLVAFAALAQFSGGAHVLTWPLLAVTLLQAWRWRTVAVRNPTPLIWFLAGLPAVVLLGATVLTFDLIIGFVLPVVFVLPLMLLFLFFTPLFDNRSARVTGFGLALFGVFGLGWFVWTSPWTTETPQSVSLFILYDGDQNQTYWASGDASLTDWHRVVLGDNPVLANTSIYQPDSSNTLWLSPINSVAPIAAEFELISADRQRGRLSVRVRPGQAGDTITLWLKPGTRLRGWLVDGQRLPLAFDDPAIWRSLTGFAIPDAGINIEFETELVGDWPQLILTSTHNDLPQGVTLPPRPADKTRARGNSDSTISIRRINVSELSASSKR